ILLSGLFLIPSATSYLVARSLGELLWGSIVVALLAALLGLLVSVAFDTATGPSIVLIATRLFGLALLFRPANHSSPRLGKSHCPGRGMMMYETEGGMIIEGKITEDVLQALREHAKERRVQDRLEVTDRLLREGEYASLRRRHDDTVDGARPRTLQEIMATITRRDANDLARAREALEQLAV